MIDKQQLKTDALSYLTISWLTPLVKLGTKRPLTNNDLYTLDNKNQSDTISKEMDKFIQLQKGGKTPKLEFFLLGLIWIPLVGSTLALVLTQAMSLAIPNFMSMVNIIHKSNHTDD
ncbi:hypothetical protein BC833DRAFT_626585 [Globomyces pollinis-pini]|nr:hypothetical protein BC833DRAFT_626585 [Globomyces pollinis-pini]